LTARLPLLTALVLAAGLTACSTAEPPQPAGPQTAIKLSATLTSPTDIRLGWTDTEAGVAGHTVEFATERGGQYTVLAFAQPSQATYAHEQLIPETDFFYRIRPYLGPASSPVEVNLPQGPGSESQEDNQEWANPKTVPAGQAASQSIRDTNTVASAAPTDLKATVMGVEGIRFTWTDHAGDEAAYLIEIKPESSPDYSVAMTVEPDINSVGVVTLPTERKASFRVRPVYYGAASNVAHLKTGKEKSDS
jgi:hypothetical protein